MDEAIPKRSEVHAREAGVLLTQSLALRYVDQKMPYLAEAQVHATLAVYYKSLGD